MTLVKKLYMVAKKLETLIPWNLINQAKKLEKQRIWETIEKNFLSRNY